MKSRHLIVGGRQGRGEAVMNHRSTRSLGLRAFACSLRLLPLQLRLAWLKWLRDELYVLHPGLPDVVREIAQVEQEVRRG